MRTKPTGRATWWSESPGTPHGKTRRAGPERLFGDGQAALGELSAKAATLRAVSQAAERGASMEISTPGSCSVRRRSGWTRAWQSRASAHYHGLMAGTRKLNDTPAPRVLARAAREGFGEFEQRVRRRPGLGGAAACLVILVVVMNFLINGPENVWGRGVVVLGLLIVITWGYVWFRRVGGGLYLFSEGFVDAAGRRVVSVAWSEIRSIEGEKTQFAIGSLPAGSAFAYEVAFTARMTGQEAVWRLNTTYSHVRKLVGLISRRSGVPVSGLTDPYQL